jgi:hypothetical protein
VALVVMVMPTVVAMAALVPVMRRRVIRARLHALLVTVAAGLIGDLRAPGDIDRQMRVGADVTEVDCAGLADARRHAAVAAVLARRRGRLPGLLALARRCLTMWPMPMPMPPSAIMSPRVVVVGGRRGERAGADRRLGRWRGGPTRIIRQVGR